MAQNVVTSYQLPVASDNQVMHSKLLATSPALAVCRTEPGEGEVLCVVNESRRGNPPPPVGGPPRRPADRPLALHRSAGE
jgi:hypothetical protein